MLLQETVTDWCLSTNKSDKKINSKIKLTEIDKRKQNEKLTGIALLYQGGDKIKS